MRLQCRNFYTMCVCHGHCVEKKNFHWKSFHEISMIYWCWLEANFEEHSVEKQDITFNEDTYYVFFILFRQKRLAYTNYCHSFSQIFRQINVVLKNFTRYKLIWRKNFAWQKIPRFHFSTVCTRTKLSQICDINSLIIKYTMFSRYLQATLKFLFYHKVWNIHYP